MLSGRYLVLAYRNLYFAHEMHACSTLNGRKDTYTHRHSIKTTTTQNKNGKAII